MQTKNHHSRFNSGCEGLPKAVKEWNNLPVDLASAGRLWARCADAAGTEDLSFPSPADSKSLTERTDLLICSELISQVDL